MGSWLKLRGHLYVGGGTTRILWSSKMGKGEGRNAVHEARLFVILLVYTEAFY